MKKYLVLIIALSLLFSFCSAIAENIIILESPEKKNYEPINMDDIKTGQTVFIDGYGEITIVMSDWAEAFGKSSGGLGVYTAEFTSPNDAVYYVIKVKILNTMIKPYNFRHDFGDVVCSFGEEYKFDGFVEELSYANGDDLTMAKGRGQATDIDPLYEGDYYVAVALPKTVKARTNGSLSITFSIGENVFTYIIRK